MICAGCGKKINQNYGKTYWNGTYCKDCAEKVADKSEATEPFRYKIKRLKEENRRLQAENAALRAELEDYKIEDRRAERISKHRAEDRARVAGKISRCNGCEYKGHSPEFEGNFRIEICKYPPFRGKWIAEIEECPAGKKQK